MIQEFPPGYRPKGNEITMLKRHLSPMFTTAQFTAAKTQNPPQCPATAGRVMWSLAQSPERMALSTVTTGTALEVIVLSERSQAETNTTPSHSCGDLLTLISHKPGELFS